jgi:predicted site-specific integrase-resolvase
MNEKIFTPRELSKLIGVSPETLKTWENSGKIKATKTEGGHTRYIYPVPIANKEFDGQEKRKYIYCRVSSNKQKHDLERQVDALKTKYPSYEIVQDIASGINFKRRGLVSILDQVIGGNVQEVVVAHKDRLTRFGFELFEFLFKRFGVILTVDSDSDIKEPVTELAKDLLSIVTVFTARYYGSRTYKVLQKNKILSNRRTNILSKPMHRGIKVLLQQNSKLS